MLSGSRRVRLSRSPRTLTDAEDVAEASAAVEAEEGEAGAVGVEVMEGEEAGMRTTPTVQSSETEGEGETGGETGLRAHLLAGSPQEVSPRGPVINLTGGTGRGQGTGTEDPAPPPMTGSPVPTNESRAPMTGRHLQAGLPRRMTGHLPQPAGLHPHTTGLPQHTTGPQATLRAELPQHTTGHHPRPAEHPLPMTGPQSILRAELPLPMTGPAPLMTGERRRPPG